MAKGAEAAENCAGCLGCETLWTHRVGFVSPPRSRSTPNMQDTSVTGGEASIGGGGGPAVPSTAHTDGTVGFERITYLPSQEEINRVNSGAQSSHESGAGGNP